MQFLIDTLLSLVVWIIVFPVAWVLFTPVILISSAFGKDPYWISVKRKYRAVTEWCGRYGWALYP